MTIKQLVRAHKMWLAEYNRAVIRRRKNIQKAMADRLAIRKTIGNNKPKGWSDPRALAAKRHLTNTIYRSVMNKAANAKCGRWTKDKKGMWGCNKCEATRGMKRRCRA